VAAAEQNVLINLIIVTPDDYSSERDAMIAAETIINTL
jgi:hypothetical protein